MPSKENKKETMSEKRDMKKSIEDLSDMVFSLALSLGTLTLITNVTTDTSLITTRIIAFALSFIILIYIWFRYTRILEIIKVETNFELILNLAIMFMVIIEPYFFNLLHTSLLSSPPDGILNFATMIFGLDIGAMMLVLGAIYSIGLMKYKGPDRSSINTGRYSLLATGTVFVLASMPVVWNYSIYGTDLRFVLWMSSALVALVVHYAKKR